MPDESRRSWARLTLYGVACGAVALVAFPLYLGWGGVLIALGAAVVVEAIF